MRAGAAVDLRGPVVEETALLAAPVVGVRDRLAALLAQWPEHPILAQLNAICDRLLGARCAAPEHQGCARHLAQALWVGKTRLAIGVARSCHCGTPGCCH